VKVLRPIIWQELFSTAPERKTSEIPKCEMWISRINAREWLASVLFSIGVKGGMGLTAGQILGFMAGLFTTFSVVPQIIKIFKNKSAKDISVIFSLMFVVGGLLWLSYGIVDRLVPIILWNSIGVTLNSMMLFAILRYMKNENKIETGKIKEE
jgi:MtN3 and saliva related transmembrane protein